jgi:hypothetical protein
VANTTTTFEVAVPKNLESAERLLAEIKDCEETIRKKAGLLLDEIETKEQELRLLRAKVKEKTGGLRDQQVMRVDAFSEFFKKNPSGLAGLESEPGSGIYKFENAVVSMTICHPQALLLRPGVLEHAAGLALIDAGFRDGRYVEAKLRRQEISNDFEEMEPVFSAVGGRGNNISITVIPNEIYVSEEARDRLKRQWPGPIEGESK